MREYVSQNSKDKKWVIFDGPVDSLWIENMNTVLDDSMTLCLSNGERVKLKPEMRMLFEVLDLAVASPATVSRCGMVYVDNEVISFVNIIESYFKNHLQLPLNGNKDHIEFLLNLLKVDFPKAIAFIRKKCKEPIPTVNNSLALSVCKNLKMILETDPYVANLENKDTAKKALAKLFCFSFIWGLGGALGETEKFERFLSEIFPPNDLPKGKLFNSFLSLAKPEGEYISWSEIIPSFEYTKEISYFECVVPTKDSVCFSWFLEKSINILNPMFLTGVTGTGKTIIINSTLNKLKKEGTIAELGIAFSAQTSSNSIQLLIESKLQTQRRNKKNILLPPPGKKMIIFVDDINMPQVEEFGAQPPIELLRQFNDYKGFFDRKNHFWKDIEVIF